MSWKCSVEEEQHDERWREKSQGHWWGSSCQRVFPQWTRFTCWTWTNSRECWETSACYQLQMFIRSLLPVRSDSGLHHLSSVPKLQVRVRTASAYPKSDRSWSRLIGFLHSSLLRGAHRLRKTPPRDLKPRCLPLLTETWTSRHLHGFSRGFSRLETFKHSAIKANVGGLWNDWSSQCGKMLNPIVKYKKWELRCLPWNTHSNMLFAQ